jgi:hypothetical protein
MKKKITSVKEGEVHEIACGVAGKPNHLWGQTSRGKLPPFSHKVSNNRKIKSDRI